ncbi:Holliday junction branch migration protein RuvA [Pseudaestuariivita atlantica]|uniref:Holliday junction branch migration complex subunit RuvA n=1 Tax=Pseudaestuariivita atlantica TaxID=1317121 RepID=A0A0L1JSP8_9RHOB|nr:Holliday junction branch migration protein RuvA [Pseudaestuariivita atlantica]KNG94780.1 ATP-dependent DNA helicase RuvA [Pseudaestuariivita atlantica]
MIGRIAGRVLYRTDEHVLIDVRGVGYLVHCSQTTLAALPPDGEAVALYTDLLVREDLLQLYGFLSLVEKEWHRLLMSVQGIGAKASLSILGALGAEGVGRAIALGDQAAIRAAKGIGPKTAQRVLVELKDKAPAVMAMAGRADGTAAAADDVIDPADAQGGTGVTARPTASTPAQGASGAAQADALSALQNLGYGPSDAAAAVAEAAGAGDASAEDLIRAALKLLAPKG